MHRLERVKRMKKGKWILAGVLIFAVAIIAGLHEENKTTTLEFAMFTGSNWGVANADSYAIVDRVIDEFEKTHKNVKVKYTSGIRREDYGEWLAQKALNGQMPDVAMVLPEDFNRLSSLGVLLNLDQTILESKNFNKADYYSTALQAGEYGNRQYALPYEVVPKLMCVNKTLLEKNGFEVPDSDWTWEDFMQMSRAITKDTDDDGILDQFAVCNYTWEDAAYSNGASLFDSEGTTSYIADESVLQAIKFRYQLKELNQGQVPGKEDFDAGKVAFMPLSYAEYRTYKRYPYRLKKYASFQWECITLPSSKGGKNISEVDSLVMGIGAGSKEKELAWELLQAFCYSKETQMDIFRYSQGASGLREVTSSKEAQEIAQENMEDEDKSIDNEMLGQIIEDGVVKPRFSKYEEAMVFINNEVNSILNEEKSVDSTMRIMQRNINKFLIQ